MLHIKKIVDMPNMPISYKDLQALFAPVYFRVQIDDSEFYISPQDHQKNHLIDAVIIKCPRSQAEVRFEVHDRAKDLPKCPNFIGTYFCIPYIPPEKKKSGLFFNADLIMPPDSTMKNPCGFSEFKLLPATKKKLKIQPEINHKSPISHGNFGIAQTELSYQVFDPFSNLKSIPVEEQNVAKPPPIKMARIKKKTDSDLEPYTTEFNRWILVCHRTSLTDYYVNNLKREIYAQHRSILNEKMDNVVQTYNFSSALKKSVDLITGFHIETPTEHVLIAETRVQAPNDSGFTLLSFFKTKPDGITVFYDQSMRYPYPRAYNNFECLFKFTTLPVSFEDLAKVDALYFHHSVIYILCSVVQKFCGLLNAQSLKEINENDFFPLETELIRLFTKAESLPSFVDHNKSISRLAQKAANRANSSVKNTQSRSKLFNLSSRVELPRIPISLSMSEEYMPEKASNARPKTSVRTKLHPKPFVASGRPATSTQRLPSKLIGVSANGEEELWAVDDIRDIAQEGYELTVVKEPTKLARSELGNPRQKPQKRKRFAASKL